jgi:hypothetical protein
MRIISDALDSATVTDSGWNTQKAFHSEASGHEARWILIEHAEGVSQ